MSGYLSIGDFSRATHMTVKTLRHYHQIGLLEPAAIDVETGYRRYATEQLPVAQVIRRFRQLGMPLADIGAVLTAPTLEARNQQIATHLSRLEQELGQTQSAIASLRDLLTTPTSADSAAPVRLSAIPATEAAAIVAVIGAEESVAWLQGALAELRATLLSQGEAQAGAAGGIYPDEVFREHRGEVTIFVPVTKPLRPAGRVTNARIPATEAAVVDHRGPPDDIDRAYGTLAAYVARHAIAVEGPIREYYLVGPGDTLDANQWHTEICWPVFRVSGAEASVQASPAPRKQ